MIGRQFAHYRITRSLGAGGMGEVWLAEDEKLGRKVALKLLPEAWARDRERLSRFEREARILASLNHAHIAQLYALEEVEGRHLLVLELVEGETLAERLRKGALGAKETVALALQIADALEAAHEQGIVHRDLKPGNLMVRPDGAVKVLDFGLARGPQPSASASLSQSPTMTAGATGAGVLVGTAPYMSPEQARGLAVDRRTDIWAFGVVLWEMLTGKRLFEGETFSDVLASILRDDSRLGELPEKTPHGLQRLIARCLVADPRQRLGWIGEARYFLNADEAEARGSTPVPSRSAGKTSSLALLALALGLTIGYAAFGGRSDPQKTVEPREVVSHLLPPEDLAFNAVDGPPVLSPDGSRLVFLAGRSGEPSHLYLRALDRPLPQRIDGTEGAALPFFSPDGHHVAFFAEGKLKRVDLAGGAPQTLADAPDPAGGTWSFENEILYLARSDGPLSLVSADGGEPRLLPPLFPDRRSPWYNHPFFLPDGDHYLITLQDLGGEHSGLHLTSVSDPGAVRTLSRRISNLAWVHPDWLVFWSDGALRAQRFDLETLQFAEDSFLLADGVAWANYYSYGRFAASRNGTVVYQPTDLPLGDTELIRVDRQGQVLEVVGERNEYYAPRIAHDGSRIAVDITDVQTTQGDIWILDPSRGTRTRLSRSDRDESSPIWTEGDREVLFSEVPDLRRRDVEAARPVEELFASDHSKDPNDLSPDGHTLLFENEDPENSDLWLLDLESKKAHPFLAGAYHEGNGRFSPDGRWIAYETEESGRREISVRSFPDGERRIVVSTSGGRIPVWSREGDELFYYSLDEEIVVHSVSWSEGTPSFGEASTLFRVRLRLPDSQEFDVYPGGDSLLVNRVQNEVDDLEMVLLQGLRGFRSDE